MGIELRYGKDLVGVAVLAGGKSSRMGQDKTRLLFHGETFLEHIMREFSGFPEKLLSVAKDMDAAKIISAASLADGSYIKDGADIIGNTSLADGTYIKNAAGTIDAAEIMDGTNQHGAVKQSLVDGWRVVPDLSEDCGPLGGIASCLKVCTSPWLFVLSCDLPRCSSDFISFLMDKASEYVTASGDTVTSEGIARLGDTTASENATTSESATISENTKISEGADLLIPVTPDGKKHMTAALYKKDLYRIMEERLAAGNYRLRDLCKKCRTITVPIEDETYARMLFNVNTPQDYMELCGEGKDA